MSINKCSFADVSIFVQRTTGNMCLKAQPKKTQIGSFEEKMLWFPLPPVAMYSLCPSVYTTIFFPPLFQQISLGVESREGKFKYKNMPKPQMTICMYYEYVLPIKLGQNCHRMKIETKTCSRNTSVKKSRHVFFFRFHIRHSLELKIGLFSRPFMRECVFVFHFI